MNKICTSIEQSKKLIELGIDVNSSDCSWILNPRDGHYILSLTAPLHDDIPAWSLTALLGLMPFHIIENNVRYEFQIVKGLNKEGGTYKIKYKSYTSLIETLMYNNPIDAAFEMICLLKENGKI